MIQDIGPKHLDNHYVECEPDKCDIIFTFTASGILGKQIDDRIEYPLFKKFSQIEGYKDRYDIMYLFAIDDVRFFLALDTEMLVKGNAQGEYADSKVHKEIESPIEGYNFIGVNAFRLAKPKEMAFAAITAFHLYGWYRDNRFCGRCGQPLNYDHNERMMKCDCCNNMIYPRINPAVIVAVTDGSRIVLTKYAGRAYKNYALIAGFAEIGETIEQTVQREVMEEVGLKVKNIAYYKSQPWALSGTLLMGFFCELDGDDTISLEEEELSIGEWVEASELDIEDDGISLTREMMVKFAKEHR